MATDVTGYGTAIVSDPKEGVFALELGGLFSGGIFNFGELLSWSGSRLLVGGGG